MTNTLISASELNAILDNNVFIFDCRFDLFNPDVGFNQYQSEHIPNAHYLHLNNDLSGQIASENGRHPLPKPEQFAALVASYGITPDSTVVVYDDKNHCYASRAWWMLHALGYTKTVVLNGGFSNWKQQGFTTNSEIPKPPEKQISSQKPINWQLPTASVEKVKTAQSQDSFFLIDARENQRFIGEVEPIDPYAGHIPGAINKTWLDAIDSEGFFKSKEFLADYWSFLKEKDSDSVHYCGSGVTACVNILSIIIAGHKPPALYSGGWSQWCGINPKKPIKS